MPSFIRDFQMSMISNDRSFKSSANDFSCHFLNLPTFLPTLEVYYTGYALVSVLASVSLKAAVRDLHTPPPFRTSRDGLDFSLTPVGCPHILPIRYNQIASRAPFSASVQQPVVQLYHIRTSNNKIANSILSTLPR